MNNHRKSRSLFNHLCNREMYGINSNVTLKDHLIKHLSLNYLYPIEDHQTAFSTMKFSPSSHLLAAAQTDNLLIFDTQRRKPIASIKDHQDLITSVVWKKRNAEDVERNCFFTSSLDKSICYYRDFERVAKLVEECGWLRCMAISSLDTTLVAGCFSDIICGYDPETLQKLWTIKEGHGHCEQYELNSIISMEFEHCSDNVFVSGARDGSVRLWDKRLKPGKSIYQFETGAKINTLEFSMDDRWLLSSSRNNTISLWDIRWLPSQENNKAPSLTNIRNYNQHVSTNYHIISKFMNYDKNIITGSEDGNVYIYDVASGDISKILKVSVDSVVHIVETSTEMCKDLIVVTSNLDNKNMHFWSPYIDGAKDTPAEINENMNSSKLRRNIYESILLKYGDKILKLFYKHDLSFGSNWLDIIQLLQSEPENCEIVHLIQEMLIDLASCLEHDEEDI